MEFTEWVRTEMEKRGWDQSELARRMKSHPGTVGNVLNGNRQAGPEFCIALARAFGISREEVFKARGWLLREPTRVIEAEADPELVGMAEAVRRLPADQRQRIINAWSATLVAAGVAYEVEIQSSVDPEQPSWRTPPEEMAKYPPWKRFLGWVIGSITMTDFKGRTRVMARKYPSFQTAVNNGRNSIVLLDKLMMVGDKLEELETKSERTAYVQEWRDDDPDVYDIVVELSNKEGKLEIPELEVGIYIGEGLMPN